MRILNSGNPFLLFSIFCIVSSSVFAQSSGKIIRSAGLTTSAAILDVGAPAGYTSKTTAGFGTDDVGNSKMPYKAIPTYSTEPFGDLRRGPNHLYTDFVPDVNGSGVYVHFDGANLLFRMRLGSVVPGAKGYSILIDTDGRFGASGANADPTYQPATTGVNGNPGFEIEIDLFTQNTSNPGIAIYDVDGIGNPVLKTSYHDWLKYSQLSIAGTSDNGDPDFFLDFFVPLADLTTFFGITASTPLRMNATTVMAPQPAIGGPKSDVYGLDDGTFKDPNVQYETYINTLPPVTLSSINNTSTTYSSATMCTAPPVITTTSIAAGSVTISGKWTKASLTGSEKSPATIRIYKITSGTSTTTPLQTLPSTVASDGSWSASISVSAGDIIYATAQALGESECLRSNTLQVPAACNASNIPAAPIIPVCSGNSGFVKGFSGTNYTTGTIYLENLSSGYIESSTSTGNKFAINGSTFTYSGGCQGGANLPGGAYRVYYQTSSGCKSEPFYFCLPGNGQEAISGSTTTTPVITSALTPGTTKLSGTGEAGAKAWLYVSGVVDPQSPVTIASNGTFEFVGLNLVQGQSVYVRSVFTSATLNLNKCGASSSTGSVNCYTNPPIITDTTKTGNLQLNVPLSGISREPAGTSIRIYEVNTAVTPNTYTLVATTTVQANGTWATTSTNATTTPSTGATATTFNAAASKTYTATAQNGTCTLSVFAKNLTTGSAPTAGRCGTIAANLISSPTTITSATPTISGTLSGTPLAGTIVNVYQDNSFIVSSAATSTSIWSATVTGKLYSGNGINTGVLTLGVQEPNKEEQVCPFSYFVTCTPPSTPTLTFKNCSSGCNEATVQSGNTLTYDIANAIVGNFYSLRDANSGKSLAFGVWASSSTFTITTNPLTIAGTYSVQLVGSSVTATEVCTVPTASRPYTVAPSPLPIHLLEFNGSHKENENVLLWQTALEANASHFEVERSISGSNFSQIGKVNLQGAGSKYTFIDNQLSATTNYYRLKMVDTDGTFSYSRIITIRSEGVLQLTAVWPNPFTEELNIETYLKESGKINIRLLNENGSQVGFKQANGHQGINNIRFECSKNLAYGVYILQIQTNEGVSQQKLIHINN